MGVQDHRLERFMARARENYSMMLSSSGLLFRVQGGTGPRPRPDDTIIVNIAAKAPDGKTDLPQISAPNVRTKVAHLLPGLAEGVQMIALGGEGFFILPPHLSFGVGEWPPGLEPGMPLLYRLTLTDVIAQPLP
jgi:FKBP-type peptidyl-prolyl cis-trans isomerase